MLAGIYPRPLATQSADQSGKRRAQQAEVVIDAMLSGEKITPEQARSRKRTSSNSSRPNGDEVGKLVRRLDHTGCARVGWPVSRDDQGQDDHGPRSARPCRKGCLRRAEAEGGKAGASQAALVAMTPEGAVVADGRWSRLFEEHLQPRRLGHAPAGSAFKLFVYYAALNGPDAVRSIEDAPIEIQRLTPENFGGGYSGMVSIAEAFRAR